LQSCVAEKASTKICRRYEWSKEFLEAGKQRLVGDTKREADSQEVEAMRSENEQLKAVVAELMLKNRNLTPALAGGAREKSLLGRAAKWDE
jgi:transposase